MNKIQNGIVVTRVKAGINEKQRQFPTSSEMKDFCLVQ